MKALLRPAKSWLQSRFRAARREYYARHRSFGPTRIVSLLRDAGIKEGDVLFVHSDFGTFAGFSGSAPDALAAFRQAVGPNGILIMPTFSMRGTAVEFARSGKVFDPRATLSQTGMLTEVFRRSPGVMRSAHPTHSVAVWGKDASTWIDGHEMADTPCGRGTPFFRLLERDGKIVLAGVGISVLTFFHCIEEILESRLPESPFTFERFVLKYKRNGAVFETAPMRLYSPALSRRRRLGLLERHLRRTGRWRERRSGALKIVVLQAVDVLRTVEEMAQRGQFCYTPK